MRDMRKMSCGDGSNAVVMKYLIMECKVPVRPDFSHSELCKDIISKNGNKISSDEAAVSMSCDIPSQNMANEGKGKISQEEVEISQTAAGPLMLR